MGIEALHASGVTITDVHGRQYTDLISGIGVSAVGHCHPHVVKAVQDQAATYMHLMVYGEYIQTPQTKLAQKLASLLPEQLQCTYFVNSGAEAIEGAMKLCKRATGRTGIITFENAYHGSTHGALSLMGNEYFKQAYRPLLPDVRILKYADESEFDHITEETAAVFIETVRGEAGIQLPPDSYLKKLRERCNATGTLLVFDEIQCGMGRTGHFFAFEKYGVIPDVLVLAKGLGGGMPIGAFCASYALMQTFTHNPVLGHITTFGGHPVNCAAALACIEVIEQEQLLAAIPEKEQCIRNMLVHPAITDIQGTGLMWSAGFADETQNRQIIEKCMEYGVITDWFLFAPDRMRIAPPLTITMDELKMALQKIRDAIDACTR